MQSAISLPEWFGDWRERDSNEVLGLTKNPAARGKAKRRGRNREEAEFCRE